MFSIIQLLFLHKTKPLYSYTYCFCLENYVLVIVAFHLPVFFGFHFCFKQSRQIIVVSITGLFDINVKLPFLFQRNFEL